jgi:hypothetical protein
MGGNIDMKSNVHSLRGNPIGVRGLVPSGTSPLRGMGRKQEAGEERAVRVS